MITVQSHIGKLEALKLYMDCWIAERSLMITLFDIYQDTGIIFLKPQALPNFETWYKMYQSTYN